MGLGRKEAALTCAFVPSDPSVYFVKSKQQFPDMDVSVRVFKCPPRDKDTLISNFKGLHLCLDTGIQKSKYYFPDMDVHV